MKFETAKVVLMKSKLQALTETTIAAIQTYFEDEQIEVEPPEYEGNWSLAGAVKSKVSDLILEATEELSDAEYLHVSRAVKAVVYPALIEQAKEQYVDAHDYKQFVRNHSAGGFKP